MANTDKQGNQLINSTVGEDASSSLFQLICELKQLTSDIVAKLAQASHEDMLAFIDARDKIVVEMQQLEQSQQSNSSSFTAFEEEIKEILSHDKQILNRLAEIQASTAEEINKSSVARKQRSAYDAAYTLDSVYFDKKK